MAFLVVCLLMAGYEIIVQTLEARPKYKTKYGVRFYWNHIKPMTGFDHIDTTLYLMILLLHKEYPGISTDIMEKKLKKLRVHILQDWDNELYKAVDQVTDKVYTVKDGQVIELQDATRKGSEIYLRRIDENILKTEFPHQVLHYLVESTGILPDEDPNHGIPYLWDKGILGRVKDRI